MHSFTKYFLLALTLLVGVMSGGCQNGQRIEAPRFFSFRVRELAPGDREDLIREALLAGDSPTIIDPQNSQNVLLVDQILRPQHSTQLFAESPRGVSGASRNVEIQGPASGAFSATVNITPLHFNTPSFPIPHSFTIQSAQGITIGQNERATFLVEFNDGSNRQSFVDTGVSMFRVDSVNREQVSGAFGAILRRDASQDASDQRRMVIFDGAYWLNRR